MISETVVNPQEHVEFLLPLFFFVECKGRLDVIFVSADSVELPDAFKVLI
jgi:hypothetical protein